MSAPRSSCPAIWLLAGLCAGTFTRPALPALAQDANGASTRSAELDAGLPPGARGQVELIFREYLLNHPEILEDATNVLEERRQLESRQKIRKALTGNRDAYFNDPADPLVGNPQGSVNLVEFFDYQCGYCKSMAADLHHRLTPGGSIRAKFKELPILGPESVVAARAALAAEKQGKYWELHQALMDNHKRLSEARIFALAESIGLDITQLRKDMADPSIDAILQRNRELADALDITGTPGFVIGTNIYHGTITPEELDTAIKNAERGRAIGRSVLRFSGAQ